MLPAEINALKRACLYSEPPNRLGYCGPKESFILFEEFLSNPSEENASNAKLALKQFNALYLYLDLIARENGKKPFDAEVIEAYWIGNSLLKNVRYREMQKTILSFQRHGLPKSIAEKKASQLPEEILPHHSMHVLYVNFISPNVKPVVKNLSNCLVQWAAVLGETNKGIRVKGIELFLEGAELKLREKEKTLQNSFGLQLQENDIVTVHWGNAIEKISTENFKNLKKYTIKNLELVSGGNG